VFKAMFDRTKDWADIEAMLEMRALDIDEALRWLSEMAGPKSRQYERLATLRPG
jgi:hypothetical protein